MLTSYKFSCLNLSFKKKLTIAAAKIKLNIVRVEGNAIIPIAPTAKNIEVNTLVLIFSDSLSAAYNITAIAVHRKPNNKLSI